MDGEELKVVTKERDLGILITNDLKCSNQCSQVYSRASRMLGMIGRTITSRSRDILVNLYKSLVRSHLEYCSPAWSPYYGKDKELLERVQHRFTRMFVELRQLHYMDRLKELGL